MKPILLSFSLLLALVPATAKERPASGFRFFPVRLSATSTPAQNHALIPKTLSATGFFTDIRAKTVGPGIFAYTINTPLWADGAEASRYLVLPGDSVLTYRNAEDDFRFPEGAVLVKNLTLDTVEAQAATRRFIETQMLVYQGGEWHGFAYRWRKSQEEADLVGGEAGGWEEDTLEVRTARGGLRRKPWLFAARINGDFRSRGHMLVSCNTCHANYGENLQSVGLTSATRGLVLGFRMPQLQRSIAGRDQIRELFDQGYLVKAPGAVYDSARTHRWFALGDSTAPGATLEMRARSYLAANCSHCHRQPFSWTQVQMDFTYSSTRTPMDFIGQRSHGRWDLPISASDTARIVYRGLPEYSVLWRRLSASDSLGYRDTADWGVFGNGIGRGPLAKTAGWPGSGRIQMPPLATYEVDSSAVKVIHAWIRSLDPDAARQANAAQAGSMGKADGRGKVKVSRGLVRLAPGMSGVTEAYLIDMRGKRILLPPVGSGVFRVPAGLQSGVYALRAGGRSFALSIFPSP